MGAWRREGLSWGLCSVVGVVTGRVFEKFNVDSRLGTFNPITYLLKSEYLRIGFRATTNLTDPEPAWHPSFQAPSDAIPSTASDVCVTGLRLPGAMPMPAGGAVSGPCALVHRPTPTMRGGNKLLVWRFDRQTGYRASQALHGHGVPRSASSRDTGDPCLS